MTDAMAFPARMDGATALKRTLAVSAAAHVVLFVALAVSVEAPRAKTLPPLRAYRVNLASPAPAAAAIAPVEAAAPKPAPPKPVSVAEKIPEKPKAPAPKKEAPKPKETAAPAKTPSGGTGGAASSPSIGSGAATGGVVGRLDAADFEFAWYLESIQRKIALAWLKPASGAAQTDAVVYFRIQRDGRVTDAAVTQSSGDSHYDRAALRAAMASSPMPPLPRQFKSDHLGVHFSFLKEDAP